MDRYNGLLNVYKEKGYTSFDVVAVLRGILKQKKIGHTGTLDPDAEGVLLVCLGRGTKLCDMLENHDKTYKCKMILGKTTDTDDISGNIISDCQADVSQKQVIDVIKSFVGEINQIPPMYSAIKINGKKLYELAREGKTIERKPKKITIYDIFDINIQLPYIIFSVACSKGTYIRSLCRDIGEKLGVGGTMCELVRTKASGFLSEEALKLDDIKEIANRDEISKYIIPVEKVFDSYTKLHVKEEADKMLMNGNPLLSYDFIENIELVDEAKYSIYSFDGRFIAIYKYSSDKEKLMPDKMFL